jgi:hypothetical protein
MPEMTLPTIAAGVKSLTPVTGSDSPDAGEVEQFVVTNQLREHLEAAIRIAEQTFPLGSEVRVRLQQSPELNGARLVVQIGTRGNVEDAVRCHQELLDRWTRELPLHVQDQITATFSLA